MSVPRSPGLSVGVRRFDVRPQSDALTAVSGPGVWMIRVELATFFVAGAVLLLFGILALGSSARAIVAVAFGVALLAGGVGATLWVRGRGSYRIETVEVSPEGVRFLPANPRLPELRWKDPKLQVTLADWRTVRMAWKKFERVPFTLTVGSVQVALTLDALKAIRQSAIDAGAELIDTLGDPRLGGRLFYIGHWPDVSRPLVPPPPYE